MAEPDKGSPMARGDEPAAPRRGGPDRTPGAQPVSDAAVHTSSLPRSDETPGTGRGAAEAPRPARASQASAAVIAVFGPTASGKSAVGERLADLLGTEVVSADSMQVYRGLPILTNQPARATHLVAFRELIEEMSVGEYAPLAHAAVDRLVKTSGRAVVVGGTGLYLRAALADLEVPAAQPPERRARIEAEYDADPGAAHERLAAADPRAAASVHQNDRRRVVRALELAEAGASLVRGEDRLWAAATRLPTLVVGLDVPPDVLESRIRARTAEMFRRGVEAEVRAAVQGSISRTAEKILGLREIATLPAAEAEERIVVRTRRYAAYQRKWMRRISGIVVLDGMLPSDAIASVITTLIGEASPRS
jgi:tRNA dimethylallyltransferase